MYKYSPETGAAAGFTKKIEAIITKNTSRIHRVMTVIFIVIYYIKYRVELYQNDVRVVENQGLTYEQQIAFLT